MFKKSASFFIPFFFFFSVCARACQSFVCTRACVCMCVCWSEWSVWTRSALPCPRCPSSLPHYPPQPCVTLFLLALPFFKTPHSCLLILSPLLPPSLPQPLFSTFVRLRGLNDRLSEDTKCSGLLS